MSNNLLEHYAELKATGYSGTHLRIFMKDYIEKNLLPQYQTRFPSHWDKGSWVWYRNNEALHRKQVGYGIGVLRAKAEKHKSVQFTDPNSDAYKAVMEYLMELYNRGEYAYRKVEPALMYIRERKSEGHWLMVDLMNRHPLADTSLSTADIERFRAYRHAVDAISVLHQLHVSEEIPSQVAYYPTLRAWRDNKAVRTSLGKYLTKYKDMFCLTESEIKSMAEKYQSEINARAGWELKYIEHDDPNGWMRVYNSEDVRSCMRGMNAVRVYAHEKSELRLAYLMAGDGKIIARCIVRDGTDNDKGWLRVYPDPNGNSEGRFLLDAIKADGYVKQTNLNGALLQAIEEAGTYVCPYIDCGDDGSQNVDVVRRDGVSYLQVTEGGDLDASETNGYAGQACSCDRCGDGGHEDDMTWIESEEICICSDCRDNNYVYAYGSRYEEYFRTDECIEVGGTWYLMDTAHNHDIYQCEINNEWYHSDYMYFFDEGQVCDDEAVAVDHPHRGDDVIHPNFVHTLSDGSTCHDDDADEYQAEIDELNEDESTNVEMSQGE